MKAPLMLSLSLLSSLLWTAMGQTTPTTAPEDYRLTIRSPSDCAPSECSYFAGVQTNEGDPTFLDFYLEGAATGWVAIGVSDSASMFSTDVLGCNVFGGTVVAKDTWNMAANTRLNSIDPTQDGLVEHSSSFVDSRITCSFSRSIAVTDSGRDLDLNGDYFVLYGMSNSPAISAGSGLAVHSFSPTPRISDNRMNLVTDEDAPPPGVLFFVPPPAPTRAPDDSRVIVSSDPGACNSSTCDLFVGISTNEDNSSFFDFYIEGEADGWVAVGFSGTQDMFSSDVLGCNLISGTTTVDVVDTWNLARSQSRLNTIDSSQEGLFLHSSSFINSRISCSFSRYTGIVNSGQDLDLTDGEYFILFGVGQTPTSAVGSALASHRPHSNPRLTASRVNIGGEVRFLRPPAPTRAPDDSRLIVSSDPGACNSSTCDLFVGISTNEDNSSFFDFYIEGEADGWVAVGFSETQDMFSSDVLGCNLISGTTTVDVVDTWNLAQSRLNTIDSTQEGLFLHSSTVIDGRISCSFSRYTGIVNSGQDLDLADGELFVLFGVGQTPTFAAGYALATHRPQSNPRLTRRVNILEESGVVGGELTTQARLIRAHGILMIIAWPVLAVTAIFFAAWMKPALPNGEWFQVHRAFMIASLFVGAAGFLLIFVAFRDAEQPGLITFSDNPTGTAHFVIGIIIMALHIANPLIAIFRCKPDGKRRWIFNLLHASTIGLLVEILALTNIGLGTSIFGRKYSQFQDLSIFWVYIGYIIFFNVLTVGLIILFIILSYTGDCEDRAKTAPSLLKCLLPSGARAKPSSTELSTLPANEEPAKEVSLDMSPERKPPSKDAPVRWVALAVYLAIMVPVMFTLIVLIAADPGP